MSNNMKDVEIVKIRLLDGTIVDMCKEEAIFVCNQDSTG